MEIVFFAFELVAERLARRQPLFDPADPEWRDGFSLRGAEPLLVARAA